MPTILDKIVERKANDLRRALSEAPVAVLEKRARSWPPALDFAAALRRHNGLNLIAEIKKASPSKGLLRPDLDPVALARVYVDSGAAAISVLTEEPHFLGSLRDLEAVARDLDARGRRRPLLRKDFLFHPYQVCEARAYGADAVLLIVAILQPKQLAELLREVHRQGMQALVEVHNAAELQTAVDSGARIIGVNNRDLRTFSTDLAVTRELAAAIPSSCIKVSESGVHTKADMSMLSAWGVDAVLIGEAFVTAPDPGAKIRELID